MAIPVHTGSRTISATNDTKYWDTSSSMWAFSFGSFTTYSVERSNTAYCFNCNQMTRWNNYANAASFSTKKQYGCTTYPLETSSYNGNLDNGSTTSPGLTCQTCKTIANYRYYYTERLYTNYVSGNRYVRLLTRLENLILTSGEKTNKYGSNAGWEIID